MGHFPLLLATAKCPFVLFFASQFGSRTELVARVLDRLGASLTMLGETTEAYQHLSRAAAVVETLTTPEPDLG